MPISKALSFPRSSVILSGWNCGSKRVGSSIALVGNFIEQHRALPALKLEELEVGRRTNFLLKIVD